jgi:hypothetical protein
MEGASPDLWPDLEQLQVVPPVAILREQAAALGKKTNCLLGGRVDTSITPAGRFKHSFYIVAPALDNYTYNLFWIEHDTDQYPVLVPKLDPAVPGPSEVKIGSENELVEYIRTVFNSDKTKKIVGGLLTQVQATTEKAGPPTNEAAEHLVAQDPNDLKSMVRGLRDEAEREAIVRTLARTRWNRKEASRRLGISYKALLNKIRRYDIDEPLGSGVAALGDYVVYPERT